MVVVVVEDGSLGSLRNTEENLEREKYLFFLVEVGEVLRRRVRGCELEVSSSVTELGRREESRESGKSEEELAVEWREAVVVVSEEEVEEEARRRVRTIERRGERWRGRSWPL